MNPHNNTNNTPQDGQLAEDLIRRLESGQTLEEGQERRQAQEHGQEQAQSPAPNQGRNPSGREADVEAVLRSVAASAKASPPDGVWAAIGQKTIYATQTPSTLSRGSGGRLGRWLPFPRITVPVLLSALGAIGVLIFIVNMPATQLPNLQGQLLFITSQSQQEATGFETNSMSIRLTELAQVGLSETPGMVHAFVKRGGVTFKLHPGPAAVRKTKPVTVWFPGGFVQTLGTEFRIDVDRSTTHLQLLAGKIWVATRQLTPASSPNFAQGPTYRLTTLKGSGSMNIDFAPLGPSGVSPEPPGIELPWPGADLRKNGAAKTSGNSWSTAPADWMERSSHILTEIEARLPAAPPQSQADPQGQIKPQPKQQMEPPQNDLAAKGPSAPKVAPPEGKVVVVYLKNGNKITGQLTQQTKTNIILKTPMGTLNIPLSEIKQWEAKP